MIKRLAVIILILIATSLFLNYFLGRPVVRSWGKVELDFGINKKISTPGNPILNISVSSVRGNFDSRGDDQSGNAIVVKNQSKVEIQLKDRIGAGLARCWLTPCEKSNVIIHDIPFDQTTKKILVNISQKGKVAEFSINLSSKYAEIETLSNPGMAILQPYQVDHTRISI